MKISRLAYGLIYLSLSSCGGYKEPNVPNREQQPTQIGDFFDRKEVKDQLLFSKSIFRITSEMNGTNGNAIYIGEKDGSFLFLTNAHIISENLDDCNQHVIIDDKYKKITLTCDKFIKSFDDLDLTLVSMKHDWNSDVSFEFIPLQFESEVSLKDFESLQLVSLDYESNNFTLDDSRDCFILDRSAKVIYDPDFNDIKSWSVPVGCDSKQGDSGAPIINDKGRVVAIIWGGVYEKFFLNSQELFNLSESRDESLWVRFNFAVPSSKIIEILKNEI